MADNKKKGTFLNSIHTSMIRSYERSDGKGTVVNVSIPVAASKTGYGSFAVNPGQVMQAYKRADKDGNREARPDYRNILLGYPTDKNPTKKVSICTGISKAGNKTFDTIEMTYDQIVAEVKAANKAYWDAQRTETETETETE